MDNTNKINNRSFFLGLGGTDAKTNVATLTELTGLISDTGEFFQTDDIVWVVGQRAFYTVDKATTPPYKIYSTGDSTGPVEASNVTIYYGKENEVLGFLQGDQSKAPSLLGYKDGDGFMSSRTISSGNIVIEKMDIYEAYVPAIPTALDPETYLFIGSTAGIDGINGDKGDTGNTGDPGVKGDKGDAFAVDAQGLLADRETDCDTRPIGFSYLATDNGLLYFKEGHTGVDTCTWSTGIPFGKGEPGETTYSVFRRELVSNPPEAPAAGTLHPATGEGWSDAPPITGDPAFRLWMSKTRYSDNTPSGNIIWTAPIMIDGAEGLDGAEGADGKGSGFWVIWSDLQTPDFTGIAKPVIDGNGDYSIDLSGSPDWYDDVNINDVPVWMGQIVLNSNTNTWDTWQFSKIAGEKPPYMIDIYKRLATQPTTPSGTIPYINGTTGTFSTGAEAAIIVGDGWSDVPPPAGESLWISELNLHHDKTNNTWSTPVKIDGEEGRQAGIWMIWSDNEIINRPADPTDCNIIDQGTTIDLSNDLEWKDDVAQLAGDAVWSATSYYKPITSTTSEWTPWNIAQIKGADGLDAQQQKIYIQFDVVGYQTIDPDSGIEGIRAFTTISDALSYVDGESNSLYDITDCYHDGGIGVSTPPPTVGNIIFKTNDDTYPLLTGTERYYVLTEYDYDVGWNVVINYIKVNQSGYIIAIYSPEEALATLPAAIINTVDTYIPDFYNETQTFNVATPFSPKFVQVYLRTKATWNLSSRTYPAQTWISVPSQTNSENDDLRGAQVSWIDNSPNTTTFTVSTTSFKVNAGSVNSGANGHRVTSSDYPYVEMVVRVFY